MVRSSPLRTGRLYPQVLIFRGWVDPGHMDLPDASEKIPSDTTGDRSRDFLTSRAAPKPLRYPRLLWISCKYNYYLSSITDSTYVDSKINLLSQSLGSCRQISYGKRFVLLHFKSKIPNKNNVESALIQKRYITTLNDDNITSPPKCLYVRYIGTTDETKFKNLDTWCNF